MLGLYKTKDYKKTVIVSDFEKVAKLLAKLTSEKDFAEGWSQTDKEFACGLRLIHDALINKEIGRRPAYLNLS